MKTLLVPIALAATFASLPAAAQQEVETRTMTVPYADLDLGSAKGQAAFETRINHAIENVCATPDERTLDARKREQACRKDSQARMAGTVSRLASASGRGSLGAVALVAPVSSVAP